MRIRSCAIFRWFNRSDRFSDYPKVRNCLGAGGGGKTMKMRGNRRRREKIN